MRPGTTGGPELDALRRLARLCGVQPAYRDLHGVERRASPEALLAVLGALGLPLAGPGDAPRALRERRREREARVSPPSALVRAGSVGARIPLRGPGSGRVRARLACEDGSTVEWSPRWTELPAHGPAGARAGREAKWLPLPGPLPPGGHRLEVRIAGRASSTLVVAAPPRAWRDEGVGRGWGGLLPLFAVRARGGWGTGRYADLATLARAIGARGGRLVGTLPLLAAPLGVPVAPGPYAPATRLLWSELYVDLEAAVREDGSAETRAALEAPGVRAEIEALRASPLVDYERAAALHHRVLAPLAARFFAAGGEGEPRFRRFLDETPEAGEWARFRAAGERQAAAWRAWPAGERDGRLGSGDVDPAAARRHLYAQGLAHAQLEAAAAGARAAGCGLYLDLPLGVHPDGFDVWRERGLYAEGISVGAPPDPFASGGQDWGFPPMLPGALLADGLRHYRRILATHMRRAALLRLDHVMGLHRLFWVPRGMDAREGVYVRYPVRELYGAVAIESVRHRCEVVGEDLGTVPDAVRAAMRERGVLRSYVLMFGLPARRGEAPLPVPEDSVASLGTHDLFPFAAFWEGADVEARAVRDPGSTNGAEGIRERARIGRAALADHLEREGRLGRERSWRAVLAAALSSLAAGPARHLIVSLDDLWGEREPHNVPGTSGPPNWRRRARLTLEVLVADPGVGALLDAVSRERGAAPAEGR